MKCIGTKEIEIHSSADGSASTRTHDVSKGMIALFHSEDHHDHGFVFESDGADGDDLGGGDDHVVQQEQECSTHAACSASSQASHLTLKVLVSTNGNGNGNGNRNRNRNNGDEENANTLTCYEANIDRSQLKLNPEQMQTDIDINIDKNRNHQTNDNDNGNGRDNGPPTCTCPCRCKSCTWFTNALLTKHTNESDSSSTMEAVYKNINLQFNNANGSANENANANANENANAIQLNIKVSSGRIPIIRIVFSQTLPQSQHPHAALHLVQQISTSLRIASSQITFLQTHQQTLERNLHGWKDTATKLHRDHWKEEKEELVAHFLVLLNRVKGDLRQVRGEVQKEKQRCRVLEEQMKRMKEDHDHLKGREMVVDHEDEHDVEIFEKGEVDRLAMGVRVGNVNDNDNGNSRSAGAGNTASVGNANTSIASYVENRKRKASAKDDASGRKRNSKSREGASSRKPPPHPHVQVPAVSVTETATTTEQPSQSQTQTQAYSQRTVDMQQSQNSTSMVGMGMDSQISTNSSSSRRNPHTGVMELWNVEDMFSDSSEGEGGGE
jgi:hypothetical protein